METMAFVDWVQVGVYVTVGHQLVMKVVMPGVAWLARVINDIVVKD